MEQCLSEQPWVKRRESGGHGAVFHSGFQKRVGQRWAERTLMSCLDGFVGALLEGRSIGHVEK